MPVLNLFSLMGKKALVTGGSAGLGRAMAEALVEAGAEVAIADRRRVFESAEEISRLGGRCIPLQVDLSKRKETLALVDRAVEALGGLDILVNNAGVQRRAPAEEFPLSDWDEELEVNLSAVFILCQAAARVMLKIGRGKIINIASSLSFFGGIALPSYTASKGGVAQLTKALANEWASKGISVNAIVPGYMATELCAAVMQDPVSNEEALSRIPAERWGQPSDMKGPVVFLASRASDYVNGALLSVDGGYIIRG